MQVRPEISSHFFPFHINVTTLSLAAVKQLNPGISVFQLARCTLTNSVELRTGSQGQVAAIIFTYWLHQKFTLRVKVFCQEV
jgi:hypothetical protein